MANKNVGGIWKRETSKGGEMLSISIEINGEKHSFVAFPNDYKEEGDKKPDYSIMPPREQAQPAKKTRQGEPVDDSEIPF